MRLLAFMSLVLFLTAATAHGLTHSPVRDYTGSECGISGYVQSARKACGVERYRSDRGEVCGPERFNARADITCPGSDGGGRSVRFLSYRSGFKVILITKNVSTVQGGEDIAALITNINDLGPITLQPTMSSGGRRVRDTLFWNCETTMGAGTSNDQWTVCTAKQFLASCEKPDFGVALWAQCENNAFGELTYLSCDDPSQPVYDSCQLRKTASEVDSYVAEVLSNIDYNAQLYAVNLGSFLARTQDKIQMACLIDRHQDKPQYAAIIGDLVDKFEANFGEIYEPGTFAEQCNTAVPASPRDMTFNELTCSSLTTEEVRDGVKASADPSAKRFYNNCFSQKAYELPRSWFQFHLDEVGLLLNDVVARKNESARQDLLNLRADLKATNAVEVP